MDNPGGFEVSGVRCQVTKDIWYWSRKSEVGKWNRCALSVYFVGSRYERDVCRVRQSIHFYTQTRRILVLKFRFDLRCCSALTTETWNQTPETFFYSRNRLQRVSYLRSCLRLYWLQLCWIWSKIELTKAYKPFIWLPFAEQAWGPWPVCYETLDLK